MDHAIIPITLPSLLPTPYPPGRTEAAIRISLLLSPISGTSSVPIRTLHTSHWGSHPICLFDQLSGALQVPGTTRWAAQAGFAWWDHSQMLCPCVTLCESWQHMEQGARCTCASLLIAQEQWCLQLGITLAAQEVNNVFGGRRACTCCFSWCLGWQCSEREGWQSVLPFLSRSLMPAWRVLKVL